MNPPPSRNRRPAPATPVRLERPDASVSALLCGLRAQLRSQYLAEHGRALNARWVDLALLEAEALAAASPFPLLVLPELAREKVATALRWTRRQAVIRQRGAIAFGA